MKGLTIHISSNHVITSYYSIFVASIQLSLRTVNRSFMSFQLYTLFRNILTLVTRTISLRTFWNCLILYWEDNLVYVFLTCVCFRTPCHMYCNKHILSCEHFEYACLNSHHFETVCCTVYILQYIGITVYISNVAL